jgi:hypothetical protein
MWLNNNFARACATVAGWRNRIIITEENGGDDQP